MKHESEDEDEADGDAEQAVDYDALNAADDEDHLVKNELEADEEDEEEVSFCHEEQCGVDD